jgi:very-short-patch-repair endonuclease
MKVKLSGLSRQRHSDPAFKQLHAQRTSEGLLRYWKSVSPVRKAEHLRGWIAAGHAASADITISSLERSVASELRRRGVAFSQQKFIGPYRVDFFLPEQKTIIECDGEYWHSRPGAAEHDAQRDAFHRGQGFRVIRLLGAEIIADAVRAVDRALTMREAIDA